MIRKQSYFSFVLVFLLSALFCPSVTLAATINVNPGQSIQSAVNAATSGDIIQVNAGDYQEQVTVSKSLTLHANGVVKTLGFIIKSDNVVVDSFDISSPKTSTGFGIRVYNSNCKISNNNIHDTWWDGVMLEASSSNCLISNNRIVRASQSGAEVRGTGHTIQNNEVVDTLQTPPGSTFTRSQGADADGFRFFGSGHSFVGNYIHDIKEGTATNPDPHIDCFQSWKDSAPRNPASNIILKDNKCFLSWDNNQTSSSKMFQFGAVTYVVAQNNQSRTRMVSIAQDGAHDIKYINNTFIGDGSLSWGIELNSGVANVTVRDNIFYHQENGYGYLPKSVTGLDAGHNCVFTTTRTPPGSPYPGDIWGKDPLFVDYTNNDFSLKSNSLCSGTGTSLLVSATPSPSTAISPLPSPTTTFKPGDANLDNVVNDIDYAIWISHYNQSISGLANGDFNSDSKVDGIDFVVWLINYGK